PTSSDDSSKTPAMNRGSAPASVTGRMRRSCSHLRRLLPPPVLRGRVGVGALPLSNLKSQIRNLTPTLTLPRSTGGGDRRDSETSPSAISPTPPSAKPSPNPSPPPPSPKS